MKCHSQTQTSIKEGQGARGDYIATAAFKLEKIRNKGEGMASFI